MPSPESLSGNDIDVFFYCVWVFCRLILSYLIYYIYIVIVIYISLYIILYIVI